MAKRVISGCLLLIMVGAFSCGSASSTQILSPTPTSVPPLQLSECGAPQNAICWNEAISYVGDYKVVCGQVVDTAYASGSDGKPTFLNLGKSYPNPERFTVVVWEENRANFPAFPEDFYLTKDICVDGLIELYKGGAQIDGRTSSQINIQ